MGFIFSDQTKWFSCYSPRVHEHLRRNGFDTFKDEANGFTGSFLNIKTTKYCHVYKMSPELSACIAEVSKPKD